MVRKTFRAHTPVAALMACALFLASCSTNPATGKRQLAFIGEEQEIAMGREAAQQAVQSIGLYPDDQLQAYVSRLGKQLAANSERPNLPWTFQVVDDPSVNAFALPGGFIFVTRGLMTHLTSEAELASVIGHEIGHVTARHSVEQMSKAQLAQIGLIAGMIVRPELANYGDLAQTGLQLLFLKYSRDDESQADDLGLRYVVRGNYDAREMPHVFDTLRRVSERESEGGRVPTWLQTHPTPESRLQRIGSEVAKLNQDFSNARVGRESYLRAVDDVVFGENPREGYFRGNTFIHPDLGFQIQFPRGWKANNQKQAVGAISPQQDAVVVVTLSDSRSPQQAAQQFFSQQGIVQGQSLQTGGLPAVTSTFGVQRGQSGDLEGIASFVEHGNRVYQILGYTLANRWRGYDNELESSLASFSRVTDRSLLSVEPQRIDVVTLPSAMTLQEFANRYRSSVDLQTLAIINEAQPGTRFPAGAEVKRVVGEQQPA